MSLLSSSVLSPWSWLKIRRLMRQVRLSLPWGDVSPVMSGGHPPLPFSSVSFSTPVQFLAVHFFFLFHFLLSFHLHDLSPPFVSVFPPLLPFLSHSPNDGKGGPAEFTRQSLRKGKGKMQKYGREEGESQEEKERKGKCTEEGKDGCLAPTGTEGQRRSRPPSAAAPNVDQ